ncbi:hypothetical protein DYI37_04965 [Fulvimarina endophytica]|uniref:Antibiotic ABC transporter n=1 Tax=Fulvimarina endophytica TaxID=2293836 RepID=A0A371X7J1_9HYPH|nr:hypothetical protein [Fulvimarina endophytica]RFC65200.1 hypothetical protein DYI37_04965 [Fulvimarina endophytica]
MARKRSNTPSAPFQKSMAEASAIMMGAPFVIGMRLTQMALAGSNPSAKDQRENHKMVAEKIAASQQSALAFNQAMIKASMELPLAMMRGTPMTAAMDTIATAALRPYSSKVTSNRKRLSK